MNAEASGGPGELAEAIIGFLHDLRGEGYRFAIPEAFAVERLLLTLAERGAMPDDLADLKRLVGPIVCGSPEQQEEFAGRFDAWAARFRAVGERDDREGTEVRREIPPPPSWVARIPGLIVGPRSRVMAALGGVAAVAGVIALFSDWLRARGYTGLAWYLIVAFLLIMIPVFAGIGAILLERLLKPLVALLRGLARNIGAWAARRGLSLRGEGTTKRSKRFRLGLTPSGPAPFARERVAETAAAMRARYEERRGLDVAAMVEQAARRGGMTVAVPGRMRVEPDYLALVERLHYRDHQAHLAHALLETIAGRGVMVDRYEFRDDPGLCVPRGRSYAEVRTLSDLRGHHPRHRLLLFCEGRSLWEPAGVADRWAGPLGDWPVKALLTPAPAAAWGRPERELARLGMPAFPATPPGLAALVERLRGEPPRPGRIEIARRFPDDLRDHPRDWLSPAAPAPERIDRMLVALASYLDDDGLRWLGTCAVYPSLEWALTLELGQKCLGLGAGAILDDGRLAAMVRLPWFRHGAMPDWLRRRILDAMPARRRREARRAIEVLLGTSAKTTARGDALEIVSEAAADPRWSGRAELRDLIDGEPEGGPLRDPLFMEVALGRSPGRGSLRLPRAPRWWPEAAEERDDDTPIRPSFLRSFLRVLFGGPAEPVRRPGARQLIVVSANHLSATERDRLIDKFPRTDFLFLTQGTAMFSTRDFRAVAADWLRLIDEFWERATPDPEAGPPYDDMIWVAEPFSTLVMRQCFLDAVLATVPHPSTLRTAAGQPIRPWSGRLSRIVFIGGYHQGWDMRLEFAERSSGDAEVMGFFRTVGLLGFLNSTERGSPGVVALNVQWVRDLARAPLLAFPSTVQVVFDDRAIDDSSMAALTELRNPPGAPPCQTVLLPPGLTLDGYLDILVEAIRNPDPRPDSPPSAGTRVNRVVFVLEWDRPTKGATSLVERVVGEVRERKLNVLVHAVPPPGTRYASYYAYDLRDRDRGRLNEFMNRYADAVTRFPGVEISILFDMAASNFLDRAETAYKSFQVDRMGFAPGSHVDGYWRMPGPSFVFDPFDSPAGSVVKHPFLPNFCRYSSEDDAIEFIHLASRRSRKWPGYDRKEGPLPAVIAWCLGLLPPGGPDDAG